MIIDVRKLKFTGKESEDYTFEYAEENSIISLPNASFDGLVKVTATVTLGGDAVYVDGHIKYNVLTECSRCLESINFQNEVEFSASYVERDPTEDDYTYKKGLIDLTQMVKEKMMMSFPYVLYCKEDCKGICPGCGVNLNLAKCKC